MLKRRRFPVDIILVCVRWYCKYGISYRDLAEMMQERGVEVEPSTIMRWSIAMPLSWRNGINPRQRC
jgi:transposase-like protein